jgi:ParB family chromosome partitioning protein
VTIGVCYERQPRFAGGAYHPVLRRVLKFEDAPIAEALKTHERHATMVLEIEARVADVIAKLRERGLTSPYLRSFVVARINPLRWIQGEIPSADKVLETMRERAGKFSVDKVKQEDLARAGGAPDEE